jgi:serine/threonine protein kinase
MHDNSNPDTAPCFLAKLHNAGDDVQVVVKFVYSYSGSYGTAVHQFLHGLGLAPRLYSAVDLHRGLVMVVMERLDFQEGIGGWVELGTFEKRLGNMADAVRSKLEQIIARLQEQGMVHADLRPQNIMVKVDGQCHVTMPEREPILSLIDFDWAGMVGEARYPPLLNPKVPWPEGTKCFKKVGQDDDRILLDIWWGPFVQPAESP